MQSLGSQSITNCLVPSGLLCVLPTSIYRVYGRGCWDLFDQRAAGGGKLYLADLLCWCVRRLNLNTSPVLSFGTI